MNIFPEEPKEFKLLPSPSEITWKKFKALVKMAKEEYDNANFEHQKKYEQAAWQVLDLWLEQFIKEQTTTVPNIFKKRR
jgi:hypothetical protein